MRIAWLYAFVNVVVRRPACRPCNSSSCEKTQVNELVNRALMCHVFGLRFIDKQIIIFIPSPSSFNIYDPCHSCYDHSSVLSLSGHQRCRESYRWVSVGCKNVLEKTVVVGNASKLAIGWHTDRRRWRQRRGLAASRLSAMGCSDGRHHAPGDWLVCQLVGRWLAGLGFKLLFNREVGDQNCWISLQCADLAWALQQLQIWNIFGGSTIGHVVATLKQ